MQRDKTKRDHTCERKWERNSFFIAKDHRCVSLLAKPAEKESHGLERSVYSTEPSVLYTVTCINRIYKLLETVFQILQRDISKAATYKKI